MSVPPQSRHRQTKARLRQLAVRLCGRLLRAGSQPYRLREDPAMVIAPHQDDETLACGGLIARKRHEGLPVHVVFITDGSASHPGHPQLGPPALAALRAAEARQATTRLGVERGAVHFLNEPDGTLKTISPVRREALVDQLAALMRTINPGEIFLPCQADGSSEHDATYGFVLDAVARTRLQPDIWQYPVWAWWNPLLLLRCWLASGECRRQPVEDFSFAKQRAIACYQSQIAPLAPQTVPALPADLVRIFSADTEYFFRPRPRAALPAVAP